MVNVNGVLGDTLEDIRYAVKKVVHILHLMTNLFHLLKQLAALVIAECHT